MSVEDEVHWAEGHVERFAGLARGGAPLQETVEDLVGFMQHTTKALAELAVEVAAMKGPRRREVPENLTAPLAGEDGCTCGLGPVVHSTGCPAYRRREEAPDG